MPYDAELDERLAAAVAGWGTVRKKAFGGLLGPSSPPAATPGR